jgi:nucleotide-binding universal stress UspA family protein
LAREKRSVEEGRAAGSPMKVLVAYDGSIFADAALNDLASAGLQRDVEIEVLTAYEADGGMFELDSRHSAALHDAAIAMSERAAVRLRRSLPNAKVKAREASGSAASCILERAQAWQADLIVLGSHSHSAFGRVLLGSVSHQVATHAHCSVRIARQQHPPERDGSRIVVGLDGSPESERALRQVASRSWQPGSRAHLVTALHTPDAEDYRSAELLAHREARLREALERVASLTQSLGERLTAAGLVVESVTREGDPSSALVEEARSLDADSIFVGVRSGHKLGRFVLGSISAAVATTAHCSVEIVRHAGR